MPNIGEVASTATAADGGPDDAVLVAEGIEKTYGSVLPFTRTVEVLDGASLELRPGEVVGIVGENGSGKSTLMEILVGTLSADAGAVDRAGTVGWCPQEPLLYPRLTVTETFDLFGEAYGMDDDAVREARDRLAERLEFGEYLDYQVRHLSGGNRQKVNLGVALMHDPDVLLLDEPYTGFDWETFLSFWDLTEELTEDGVAIAVISHFVTEHGRFDRVLDLADGRLTEREEGGPGAAGADREGDRREGA